MEIKKIEESKLNNPDTFDNKKAIIIIVIFMIIVASIWYAVSRPGSQKIKDIPKPDLTPSASSTTKKIDKISEPQDSFYKGYVKITNNTSKETYPEKEYITIAITQQNLSEVDITNWKLQNAKGETVSLGKGTTLPYTGQVNPVFPIKLKGGDFLTVSTGRSPIGVSFQMNSCASYLEQFQDFIPPIAISCPSPRDNKSFYTLDSSCQKYIAQIPKCTTNAKILPSDLSAPCMTFIYSKVNYNGCVSAHKNDTTFSSKEWRIFLGRTTELWNNKGDTITLLDSEGKVIGTIKY